MWVLSSLDVCAPTWTLTPVLCVTFSKSIQRESGEGVDIVDDPTELTVEVLTQALGWSPNEGSIDATNC